MTDKQKEARPTLVRHVEEYRRGYIFNAEKRHWVPQSFNPKQPMGIGTSSVQTVCPFCGTRQILSVPGVRGSGRRCSTITCQAMFVGGGEVYRLKQETTNAE